MARKQEPEASGSLSKTSIKMRRTLPHQRSTRTTYLLAETTHTLENPQCIPCRSPQLIQRK